MKVGFAGAGNMAAAMARGWAAGEGGPEAMLFSDAGSGRAAALADELGGETRADARRARGGTPTSSCWRSSRPPSTRPPEALGGRAQALLSVLGATPLDRLEAAFPGAPVLRTMPNLAGRGPAGRDLPHAAVAVSDAARAPRSWRCSGCSAARSSSRSD